MSLSIASFTSNSPFGFFFSVTSTTLIRLSLYLPPNDRTVRFSLRSTLQQILLDRVVRMNNLLLLLSNEILAYSVLPTPSVRAMPVYNRVRRHFSCSSEDASRLHNLLKSKPLFRSRLLSICFFPITALGRAHESCVSCSVMFTNYRGLTNSYVLIWSHAPKAPYFFRKHFFCVVVF